MVTKEELNKMLLDGIDTATAKQRTRRARKTSRPTFEELYTNYVIEAKTSTELAEYYNVKPSTVRAWFSRMKRERLRELEGGTV